MALWLRCREPKSGCIPVRLPHSHKPGCHAGGDLGATSSQTYRTGHRATSLVVVANSSAPPEVFEGRTRFAQALARESL
jgi:hypothetical protein